MWHQFPTMRHVDSELMEHITGKHLPSNYSQKRIRQYMIKAIHRMSMKFLFTKAGIWFGGRLSFARYAVVEGRKLEGDFLQLITKIDQEEILESHLSDDVCGCGILGPHTFTEAPLRIIYEVNNSYQENQENQESEEQQTEAQKTRARTIPSLTPELQETIAHGVLFHTMDLIALHLILMALSQYFRCDIPPEWLALSPLTMLVNSQEGSQVLSENSLAPLFLRNRPLILAFLDNYLSQTWFREEILRRERFNQTWGDETEDLQLRAELGNRTMASYQQMTGVINNFISQAEEHGDVDVLSSLLLFFKEMAKLPDGRTIDLYRNMSRIYSQAVGGQDAFLRVVADFINTGQILITIAEDILYIPFHDKTEHQKIFSAQYHVIFIDNHIPAWINSVYRACAGIIG